MSIKCGNCHKSHETVSEVRACYGNPQSSPPGYAEHFAGNPSAHGYDGHLNGPGHEWRNDPATDNQLRKLRQLRDQSQVAARYTGQITKGQASEEIGDLINYLKAQRAARQPAKVKVAPSAVDHADTGEADWHGERQVRFAQASEFPGIVTGYYATPSLTGHNDYDFWNVNAPEEGRWTGFLFVKRVIGGRDDQDIPRDSKKRVKSQRLPKVTQRSALEAIRDFGPEKAHELFGTELKYCRCCGIHLTDELSRELGIGPVCRSR